MGSAAGVGSLDDSLCCCPCPHHRCLNVCRSPQTQLSVRRSKESALFRAKCNPLATCLMAMSPAIEPHVQAEWLQACAESASSAISNGTPAAAYYAVAVSAGSPGRRTCPKLPCGVRSSYPFEPGSITIARAAWKTWRPISSRTSMRNWHAILPSASR
jgi:hypothetical protein